MRYALSNPDAVPVRFQTAKGLTGKPNFDLHPGIMNPIVYNDGHENQLCMGLYELTPSWTITYRCLVIADGFYMIKERQPFFVHLKSRDLFGMAGLFSVNSSFRPALTSFTILPATPKIWKDVHWLPAILRPEDEARYLDPKTPHKEAQALCQTCPEEALEMHPATLPREESNSKVFFLPMEAGIARIVRKKALLPRPLRFLN